jgi:hypothetical protein
MQRKVQLKLQSSPSGNQEGQWCSCSTHGLLRAQIWTGVSDVNSPLRWFGPPPADCILFQWATFYSMWEPGKETLMRLRTSKKHTHTSTQHQRQNLYRCTSWCLICIWVISTWQHALFQPLRHAKWSHNWLKNREQQRDESKHHQLYTTPQKEVTLRAFAHTNSCIQSHKMKPEHS